jgi:formylglycine-generating enzyme required for sulfatase activity
MAHNRSRMERLVLLAALCLTIGCVKGRCYDKRDCPSNQVCNPSGACVFECSPSTPCASGFTCVDHACRPLPAAPLSCPADMVAVAGTICIDRFESSRGDATPTHPGHDGSQAHSVAGVLPWQVNNNAEADQACVAAGKRLCSPAEWQLACKGPDGTPYAYGTSYNPDTCNGIDAFAGGNFHLAPTGSFPACTNAWGILDMNGNLWEHVAGGSARTVRGGAYTCSDSATLHRCDYVPGTWTPSALGFRCCGSSQTADAGPTVSMNSDAASMDIAVEIGCMGDAAQTSLDGVPDAPADVPVETIPDAMDLDAALAAMDAVPDAPAVLAAKDALPDSPDGGDATAGCLPLMASIGDFCIDIYEASHSDATASIGGSSTIASTQRGVIPWLGVDINQARAACASMGKRLCQPGEWFTACSLDGSNNYVYGKSYRPATCNGIDTFCQCTSAACATVPSCPYPHCFNQAAPGYSSACGSDFHLTPTGSFPACTNAYGLMDVNGNAWELVDSSDGLDHFRGGAYNCTDSEMLHRCDYDATWNPSAKGFRCCTDRKTP